ncbi:MAG: hypothetical protein ABI592_03400 [Acidobacteriota bacterium]
MTFRRVLLAAAALFVAVGSHALRADEKSLLAPDGTLYNVRSGRAADLGVAGDGIRPDDNLIEWSSLTQDGQRKMGLVPNTVSANLKTNLDLAYDDIGSSLVLLWKEDISVINVLHLGLLQAGAWKQLDLLPSLGFAHAYNPQMLLSRQSTHYLDDAGKDAWRMRTLLSVIWWEEAQYAQARYAPIFLDEDTSPNDVTVYDLPTMVGSGGATSYGDVPSSVFMYPSLQLEGPGGGILASFADLSSGTHYVVRINYPTDLGVADATSKTWLRRRIPVFGVAMSSHLASLPMINAPIVTVIGPSYNPTFLWVADGAVRFTRYNAAAGQWSALRSVAITPEMSQDRAIRLVQEMATKN